MQLLGPKSFGFGSPFKGHGMVDDPVMDRLIISRALLAALVPTSVSSHARVALPICPMETLFCITYAQIRSSTVMHGSKF